MLVVELAYPVLGGAALPTDNGYPLYAAISRALNDHLPEGASICAIGGPHWDRGRVYVTPETRLRVRAPTEHIGAFLTLAGRYLDVAGQEIGLGIPQVYAPTPTPTVSARIVTIKGFQEPDGFLDAARRQLDALEVVGTAAVPLARMGPTAGQPARRVVRIKGKTVVGFGLSVSGLSPEHSLKLLSHGLGGRKHMGCGFFVSNLEEAPKAKKGPRR